MAKKTPRKQRKPTTLDAISGTDALEVLRILAHRDKELSQEIDVIAKNLLANVSLDEVAECVQAELESLAVEDVWDHSGARRDGYVDTGETAWKMFEAALEPFREDMLKYQQLSMFEQAEVVCWGILQGVYDFQWSSKTEFKDWAVDAPAEFFGTYLGEWKKHFEPRSSRAKLNQFLAEHCLKWASESEHDH
ncbi:MAG: hypothetical protein ACYC3X_15500 [Pirellulaceae bacterium]